MIMPGAGAHGSEVKIYKNMDEFIFNNKNPLKIVANLGFYLVASLIASAALLNVALSFLAVWLEVFRSASELAFYLLVVLAIVVFGTILYFLIREVLQNTYLSLNRDGVEYVQNDSVIFYYPWQSIQGFHISPNKSGGVQCRIELAGGITFEGSSFYGNASTLIPDRVGKYNIRKIIKAAQILNAKYDLNIDIKNIHGDNISSHKL